MFALNQREMCAASVEDRTTENGTVFNTQAEPFASEPQTEVDNGWELPFSRVFEALQKTFKFVKGTGPTDNSKKRKIPEDDSRHIINKKLKTDVEECVSKSDTDCSICFAPWSASGDHRLTSLKCGHLFGHRCIVEWLHNNHNCPYCCTDAEIADLRNIFAHKVQVEDTTDRDLAIEQLKEEKAAKKELTRQLTRQKQDNKKLRLELNRLKGRRSAGKTRSFSAGFGIVAALAAVKDSLSRRLSRALTYRRQQGMYDWLIPSVLLYRFENLIYLAGALFLIDEVLQYIWGRLFEQHWCR